MTQKMDIKFYLKFSAKPVWNTVFEIRQKIKALIAKKKFTEEVIEAMETVSMELFENAIKYGVSTEDATDVSLEIIYDEISELKIIVSNGIESKDSIKNFSELIESILNSKDLEAMYMQRLNEIAQNPKSGKSYLGLYRIAYETGFKLAYEITGKKLIVIASREIEDES